MKKMWIKKDNIYYKPFYKQKVKVTLILVFLMGIIFISYQLFYLSQLSDSAKTFHLVSVKPSLDQIKVFEITEKYILRGIRLRDYELYIPTAKNTFNCLKTQKEIPFKWVNDNYCDCPKDGSDEPGTNACSEGVFYCKYQTRHKTDTGIDVFIPSNFVNDGICDCCDGSDEYRSDIKCKNICT